MVKKKKKMTFIIILIIYLVVSSIAYLLSGGFYFTRIFIDKDLKSNNMSIDQLDCSKDKLREGVFAGIVEFKDQKNYLFEFSDMFKNQDRLLNIYFPIESGDAYFIESQEKISGDRALFLIQKGKDKKNANNAETNGKEEIFNSYFNGTKLPNPQVFLQKTDTDTTITSDLFILSINVSDNRFQVKMLNFVKNNYGYYGLIRKKADSDKNEWQLKDTSVNKDKVQHGIFKHILIAIADIVTAVVQLIVAILYAIFLFFQFIYLLFTKGPVK